MLNSTPQPDKLRVLHVASGLGPRVGGPSKAAVEMCEALARYGAEVTLYGTNVDIPGRWLSWTPKSVMDVPVDRRIYRNGVSVRYFPTHWPHPFAFSPSMARELRDVMRTFDIVHVHSVYLFPTLAASHYARRFHVPYLVRPHGTLHPYIRRRHRRRKALYNALVERRTLDHAAAIHYTSTNELEAARPLGLRAPGVVIPLGVAPGEFGSLPPRGAFRRRRPNLADKRLIVFLGRLTRKKGLDLLIAAVARVMKKIDGVHLVIAGPDDEGYGATVRDFLQRAGIAEQTSMIGMVSGREKLELLADADAWVLPSYTENFGLAVVEAMACGLPVVISDQVDIHREVSEASAGLVVPCDASAIAGALSRLLNDPAFAKDLGSAAQGLVQKRFSWEAVASQLLDTYTSIVSDRELGGVHREDRIANVRAR